MIMIPERHGQTDRRTDGRLTVALPRSALASRGKNGMRVYCLDIEIRRNILSFLHALKDLRGLLFYALRSFPTDISEDFSGEFIDS